METAQQEIKEEPIEEFYVPEPLLHQLQADVFEKNEIDVCCLCLEGTRLQHKLLEHVQSFHCSADGE